MVIINHICCNVKYLLSYQFQELTMGLKSLHVATAVELCKCYLLKGVSGTDWPNFIDSLFFGSRQFLPVPKQPQNVP